MPADNAHMEETEEIKNVAFYQKWGGVFRHWWPMVAMVLGVVYWGGQIDERVVQAEQKAESNQATLEDIRETLQTFSDHQQKHNGQDLGFQGRITGEVATFKAEMKGELHVIQIGLNTIIKNQDRAMDRLYKIPSKIIAPAK